MLQSTLSKSSQDIENQQPILFRDHGFLPSNNGNQHLMVSALSTSHGYFDNDSHCRGNSDIIFWSSTPPKWQVNHARFSITFQNLENDVKIDNNPTPSISQLKIKPYSLALEKRSTIFSVPITKFAFIPFIFGVLKSGPLHIWSF